MERYETPDEYWERSDGFGTGCLILTAESPFIMDLKFLRRLREKDLERPVIVIGDAITVPRAVEFMKMGACDVFDRPVNFRQLRRSVEGAIARDARQCVSRRRRLEARDRLCVLSRREREVLELVATGTTNRVIGEQLGIALGTVEVHRSRVAKKTGVRALRELFHVVIVASSAAQGV